MTNDFQDAINAATGVLDAHIEALNVGDEIALAKTLHFPQYRLTGNVLKTWETSDDYFRDFKARAGGEWDHSAFGHVAVIHAREDKVHLDVRVDRFRADGSLITSFPSIWVMTIADGIWAAQLRSTMADR